MGLSDVIRNLFASSDELEYFEDEQAQYIEEDDTPKKSFLDIFKKNKGQNDQNVPTQNPFLRPTHNPQYNNNGIIKSIAPTDFNTASRNIVSDLKSGFVLILNLEGSPIELQNRILDFTYGCVCSLGGNLKKISNSIYITGIDVDLSAFASSFSNTVYNNMNSNYDNSNMSNNFNNIFHNAGQNNSAPNPSVSNNQGPEQNQYPQNDSNNFWNNFSSMGQNQNAPRSNNPNFSNNYFNNNFNNFANPNSVQKPNFFKR